MDTSTRFRECCHFAHTFYSHLDSQASESLGAKVSSRESVVWENAIQQTVNPSCGSEFQIIFFFISDLSVKSPERWLLPRPQDHHPNDEVRDYKNKSWLPSVKDRVRSRHHHKKWTKLPLNSQWRKCWDPSEENASGKNENVAIALHTHHSRAR